MSVKKVKKDIDVKYVIDTRERDLNYTKDILDKRRGSDGIKFTEIEVKTCKPNGMKVSSGDVTIEYRVAGTEDEWIESKFVLEIKKGYWLEIKCILDHGTFYSQETYTIKRKHDSRRSDTKER